MRAVVFSEVAGPLGLQELPNPFCPSDGVVIEVRATGVCRSDWHAWQGHDPVALPHVPGHELAGVIAEIGEGVAGWEVGDRVTVPFVCGCGRCDYCLAGESQVCPDQTQPGFTHHGSFAERVTIHAAEHNLVRLPEEIDFVTAASLGCRFATAYRALTVHGQVSAGDRVAVFGCGGVGLSAIMIAKALGAAVSAVDVSDTALDRAGALGADRLINARDVHDPASVAELVREPSTDGMHVSVDALGRADTAVASVLSLRRRGRHLQVGLLLGDQSTPLLPMDRVVGWELSVHGSHGMAADAYPALLDLIIAGRLDPALLVGRTLGLDQAGAALADLDSAAAEHGITVIVP